MYAHHAAKMENQVKFDRIAALAKATNYKVEFRPTKYVRGWPQASTRPYLLQQWRWIVHRCILQSHIA